VVSRWRAHGARLAGDTVPEGSGIAGIASIERTAGGPAIPAFQTAVAALYEVERLTKVYRRGRDVVTANDDVSLALERGEVLGLLGENGAGKTTLVRQLLNLLAPTSGRVLLDGRDIRTEPELVPRLVSYLAQRPYGFQELTPWQAVYFTAHLRGLSRADSRAEADRLVEEWQLGAHRDRPIRRLSGGQGRLAGLAVALAGRSEVLVLDEPTNELDPANRHHVWQSLLRRNREEGTTILLVTHHLLEAERVVQRVAIMRRGRLIAAGRPGALKARLTPTAQVEVALAPAAAQDRAARVLREGWADTARPAGADRWSLTVPRAELGTVVPRLLAELGADAIEDLRLQTHSLEDLYLAFERESGKGVEA
jgi:ABC-type multidrug transport system ATPase subunit